MVNTRIFNILLIKWKLLKLQLKATANDHFFFPHQEEQNF